MPRSFSREEWKKHTIVGGDMFDGMIRVVMGALSWTLVGSGEYVGDDEMKKNEETRENDECCRGDLVGVVF